MFFKNFDYLGNVFGFTYDDSMRFQTNCGGFLSIILALLSLITIGWMGASFFDRSNPNIVQDVAKNEIPPPIYFENRFNIAMRMTTGVDNLYQNLDMVTIKLHLIYVYNSNFSNISTTNIPLFPCTPEKFPTKVRHLYDSMSLNESLCPELNGLKIEGDFLSENNYFLSIQFEECVNDPSTGKSTTGSGVTCRSKDEISDFLSKNTVKAHLFYTDSNYITKNYEDPLDVYISNYNINIYYHTQRESHMYFYLNNLTSDDTYFFLSPSKRVFSSISNNLVQERAAYREANMNDMVIINLKADDNIYTILRSYTGFSDIAANVGAILNIVMLFFSSTVFLITRIQFFSRMMRNSFFLYYKNPQFMINLTSEAQPGVEQFVRKIEKTESSQLAKVEESHAQLNNTGLQEGKLKPISIELLNINKGAETKHTKATFLTKITKDSELVKKLDNFQIQKYKNQTGLLSVVVLAFCPFFNVCSGKIHKEIKVMEYTKKHYYRYTDFFRFLDKFIELNIFKKLFLKKEEQEIIDVLKKIVLVKKFDILDMINPRVEESAHYKSTAANLSDKLKKKDSLVANEQKLKRYISQIINKDQKSTLEINLIEKFDELFRG